MAQAKAKAVVVRVELARVDRAARPVVWYAATADLDAFVRRLEEAMTPRGQGPEGTEIGIEAQDSEPLQALGRLIPWWARWGMVSRILRDQESGAVVRARLSPEAVHVVDQATAEEIAQAMAQKELKL